MLVVVLVVLGVALAGMYLSWTAGRLDRLHNRVDAAQASLDARLVRRAAATQELAQVAAGRGVLPQPSADELASAAHRARAAGDDGRQVAEDALTKVIRQELGDPETLARLRTDGPTAALLDELDAAQTTVTLARRFHAVAVHDTLALRSRSLVRFLRLAGRAPLPSYFTLDDTPVPLGHSADSGVG